MSQLQKFEDAADTLSRLDISGLVTSMALGIAEAQRQMDDNSVYQAIILADPANGINGTSLLELGFVPSFYQFQYVDITAYMSLNIKSESSFSLDASFSIGLNTDKSELSSSDVLLYNRDSKKRRAYRSTRGVVMKNSTSTSILVGENQEVVQIQQSSGAYSKLHNAAADIRQVTEVDRVETELVSKQASVNDVASSSEVHLAHVNGYLTIATDSYLDKDVAIFRISDGTLETEAKVEDTLDTSTDFTVKTNGRIPLYEAYQKVVHDAGSPGVTIGYFDDGIYEVTPQTGTYTYGLSDVVTKDPVTIYFEHDVRVIETGYVLDGNTVNVPMLEHLKRIALILSKDNTASVVVTGFTDKSGEPDYNDPLSKDRALAVKNWLISKGAKASQITERYVGEKQAVGPTEKYGLDRKATVEFNSGGGYIYMEDGRLNISHIATSGPGIGTNAFIYTHAGNGTTPALNIDATVDRDGEVATLDYTTATFSSVADLAASTFKDDLASEKYLGLEVYNDIAYAIHEDERVQFTAYSKTVDDIKMVTSSSSSSSTTNSNEVTDEVVIEESANESTYASSDAQTYKKDKTFELDASLDVRTAKRFDFSIEGNSSMSARMVAIPAPTDFTTLLINNFNQP